MGLHNTAHYLKSKGRGRDTELVHMSKREIKGLQDLALAHGGTLSINPETGLVEAGFLEQILPVVAAAGLTYLTAGAAAPTLTAALGGSAMAGGIAAGALSGAAISGGLAAIQGKDAGQAALMGGLGGGIAGGMGAYDAANLFNAPNLLADTTQQISTAAPDVAATALQEGAKIAPTAVAPDVSTNLAGYNISMPNPSSPGAFINPETGQAIATPLYPNATQAGINAANMAPGEAQRAALNQVAQNTGTLAEGSRQLTGQGLAAAPQPTFYQNQGTMGRMAIQGLPALGLLMDEQEQQQVGPQDNYVSPLQRISPNFRAYQPPQPNPYYRPQYPTYAAEGGIMSSYQAGGPVERMSMMNTAMNPQGGLYPQGMIDKTQYATPTQRPVSAELMMDTPAYERSNPMLMASGGITGYALGGVPKQTYLPRGDAGRVVDSDPSTRSLSALDAAQYRLKKLMGKSGIKMAEMPKTGIKSLGGDFSDMAAAGGVAHLGDYSDGGRLLKGPGDGVSDNIPASIGGKQPARLADGEFVVPARIVSELGNGSTDAGARRLYAMMDRVQKARKKTIGKGKIAKDSKSSRYLPA
jgi:hypothetical protein